MKSPVEPLSTIMTAPQLFAYTSLMKSPVEPLSTIMTAPQLFTWPGSLINRLLARTDAIACVRSLLVSVSPCTVRCCNSSPLMVLTLAIPCDDGLLLIGSGVACMCCPAKCTWSLTELLSLKALMAWCSYGQCDLAPCHSDTNDAAGSTGTPPDSHVVLE